MEVIVKIKEQNRTHCIPVKIEYNEVIHINDHNRTVNVVEREDIRSHFNGTESNSKIKSYNY